MIQTLVYLKADTISRSYRLLEKPDSMTKMRPYSLLAVLTIGPYLELPDL